MPPPPPHVVSAAPTVCMHIAIHFNSLWSSKKNSLDRVELSSLKYKFTSGLIKFELRFVKLISFKLNLVRITLMFSLASRLPYSIYIIKLICLSLLADAMGIESIDIELF